MESIPAGLSGLGWLVFLLVPLIVIQRLLHREIQLNLLLLTRRPDLSVIIFSLLFLPGVFLHETSHYLAARLLGVRTGNFSIIPRAVPGGKLQLGYVETAPVDWLRESIIGIAPLVSGMAFVAYAGLVQLQLTGWWDLARNVQLQETWEGLKQMGAQPDFWLWFYLVLTVSSMMFPSSSDRRVLAAAGDQRRDTACDQHLPGSRSLDGTAPGAAVGPLFPGYGGGFRHQPAGARAAVPAIPAGTHTADTPDGGRGGMISSDIIDSLRSHSLPFDLLRRFRCQEVRFAS